MDKNTSGIISKMKIFITNNNINQKTLSKKALMTESALSQSLNGKRKLNADEYIRLCDAMCLPYETFVSNKSNMYVQKETA